VKRLVHPDMQAKAMQTTDQLAAPITETDHAQGSESAAVTLVEYGDYQCPHCAMAHPVIKALQQHFADDLRFVFRHFPLMQIHAFAEPACETAELSGAFGRFWPMHDSLYENQEMLGVPLFVALSEALGMPKQKLIHALTHHDFRAKIETDVVGGMRSGVSVTPTFFINGNRYQGANDFSTLAIAIRGYRQQGGSHLYDRT